MRQLFLAILLLIPVAAPAKPFYKTKSWWIGEAGSAVVIGLDAWSTSVGLRRCPGCGDNFPFFSLHGKGSLAAAAAINLGVSTGGHFLEHHVSADSPDKWYRYTGDYMELGIDASIHGWAINHNLNFECHTAGIHC